MNAPDALHRFHHQFPQLGTDPVGIEAVISPEYFELEREHIFRKMWLNVCREQEIPHVNDYLVRNIAILNTSIIVARGEDGVVRAFHNVCRHRGNQVAAGQGNAKGFACGFHGWTYDTAGRCQFIPDQDVFFGVDRADMGLVALRCETWAGFVFITVNPDAPPLRTYLGGMADQLEGFPFHEMVRMHRLQADVKCNWKVFLDAFQEGYHAAFVHALTAEGTCAKDTDPYAHAQSVRLHGPHRSVSLPFNTQYRPTPAETVSLKYGTSLFLHEGSTQARFLPGSNPGGHANWLFDINVLFPNFFVDVAGGWFFTYHFWPVAVDRTHWEYSFYMLPADDAGQRISREFSKVYLRDLLREDLSTVERTQAGLDSGAIRHIHLSDQEVAVRHQYAVVDALVHARPSPFTVGL